MVVYKEITEIKENPKNPRVITDKNFKRLVKSIKEFPEMLEKRPLICVTDPQDNKIFPLGGNMRLRACNEAGLKTVPVEMADDWTEDQRKQFVIKDNVGFGDWNWLDLQDEGEWDVKKLENWGLDIPDKFLKKNPGEEDNFQFPQDGFETDIVEGDYFDIGPHRLLCGNSSKRENWERLMGKEKMDLLNTDPPYNVDLYANPKEVKVRKLRTDGLTIQNDKMSDKDFLKFLTNHFELTKAFSKPGAAAYIFFSPTEVRNFSIAFTDHYKLSQVLVWKKQTMVLSRKDYHPMYEPILYGWVEGAAHNWYSDRKQTTVFEFDRPTKSTDHPTMKPIPLISYLINNSSQHNDIVGDGYLGSGTAMVASHQLRRRCFGMELSPRFCQVIINRMRALDPKIKIKKNGK